MGNCPEEQRNVGLYLNEGVKHSGVTWQIFPGQSQGGFLLTTPSSLEMGFPGRNYHGDTGGGDFSMPANSIISHYNYL